MTTMRDAVLLMDAMARADRQSAMFSTTCLVSAVEAEGMQVTTAAHAIGEALGIPVQVLDAERVNLNDLHHPSPLREIAEHASKYGSRILMVLRGRSILANDRRLPVLAAMLGSKSKLILALDDEPHAIPGQVICDLRA